MNATHRISALAAALAIVGAAQATSAAAQVCNANPARQGGTVIQAVAGFPEGANRFGGEIGTRLGALGLAGGYSLLDIEDVEENAHQFHARAAFEVPVGTGGASVCPTVGVEHQRFSVDVLGEEFESTLTTVPIGLGLGGAFPVGNGSELQPYVIPAFVWGRADFDAAGLEGDEDDTGFQVRTGTYLDFGSFLFGAGYQYRKFSDVDEGDDEFSVSFGFKL